MLSSNQLQEFQELGYLKLPQVFPTARVQQIMQAVHSQYEMSRGIEDGKSWGSIFHQNYSAEKSTNVWEMRNIVAHDRQFLELIDEPQILSSMCQLLSARISLLSSHLIIRSKSSLTKEEVHSKPLFWHRDLGVSSVEMVEPHPRLAIKAAIWLTPLTDSHQGAMQIVPGSHRLIGKPAMNSETNSPYGAIEVFAEPGDVLLFEQRLWHAGAPNLSQDPRICIFLGYGFRWLRPQDYSQFSEEFLSKLSPLRQQLLGKAVTEMGYHLPTSEDLPLETWLEDIEGQ